MSQSRTNDPSRFEASRGTLRLDAFMTWFIRSGGVLVILAVFGIFAFILFQILPLFRGAHVEEVGSVQFPPQTEVLAVGADEWTELPFAVDRSGKLRLFDLAGNRGLIEEPEPLQGAGAELTALAYSPQRRTFAVGRADGTFLLVGLKYRAAFEAGQRKVSHSLERGPVLPLGDAGAVRLIASGESDDRKLVAAVQESDGKPAFRVALLARKRTLMGAGPLEVKRVFDLTAHLNGSPRQLLVGSTGDSVLVLQENGEIDYFHLQGEEFELRQQFRPFGDLADARVVSMGFLLGDVSVVSTHGSGLQRIHSLYVKPGEKVRTFGQTKEFPALGGETRFLSQGLRNKAFLVAAGGEVSLRYGTTESIRWQQRFPYEVRLGVIGGKYESLLLLDAESRLHRFELEDPHPESSLRGLLGKLWYEGADAPKFEWQSTGGSDEFEPKLSLVPLIVGTLKGTLYAMLFAVPIALLAALYTSQFLHSSHRFLVKPTMEIMASLPSVVLGFLAALWLAPVLDDRIPSLLAVCVLLPLAAFAFGWAWSRMPIRFRILVPAGWEYLAFAPILVAIGWAGWQAGPWIEQLCFAVIDPSTGARVADFRRWWPAATGTPYEQRNSLVVGFMMGFAVIPIIFTIAEDALSNVPQTLRSGSLALGASRWQTAMRVVVPTASPGIFSALMVGLGRAVGETMIVVMATGNTPIMDLNIFSGMRTLSANIAVELPEAPQGGTLYRALFLGAMVLFLMTFAVNTLAEVLRQHLREKYKTV